MDKSALTKEIKKALKQYQGLTLDTSGSLLRVHGDLDVSHTDGRVIDTFSVEIAYPDRYPFCYPKVWETGGRIPPIVERHVFPNTKNLCLGTPEEETLNCLNRINTRWFMGRILIPRLADEHRVITYKVPYTHGYAHGPEGRWRFFMKHLNSQKTEDVLMWLKMIASKNLPGGTELCPCKSHLPFKKCHEDTITKMKKIGRDTAVRWYLYLTENPYTSAA